MIFLRFGKGLTTLTALSNVLVDKFFEILFITRDFKRKNKDKANAKKPIKSNIIDELVRSFSA